MELMDALTFVNVNGVIRSVKSLLFEKEKRTRPQIADDRRSRSELKRRGAST